jgi:hypothetical protein
MATRKYQVFINGFVCTNQTWDDSLNRDGKADEVFIAVGYKRANKNGTILESKEPDQTPVMGDTWDQPNRIQAGSAWGGRGGIISGDAFPTRYPWIQSIPPQDDRNWPPYKVWEGNLTQGDDAVFITPTIWEWDPGQDAWSGLIDWFRKADDKFGPKAKSIITGQYPAIGWIVEAASLGLQVLATIPGLWSLGGKAMNRPIGTQRDPNNPEGYLFSPQTLVLTYDLAERLCQENPHGKGIGVLSFRYSDDPFLRGDYTLYVQVKAGHDHVDVFPDLSIVRETSRPEVYVIVGGAKFWIPDPPTLFRLYGGWAAVRVVPDGTLKNVSSHPKEGTILREEHAPYVWRIEGAQKRHITTPTVLFRYGGWDNVRVVPDHSLAMIPIGPPIY